MGYDAMGYELWKPYLRAMMEGELKAVSIGSKTKDEILATCLQQMKACFLGAKSNKEKLFEAMELFFERSQRQGGGEQNAVGDIVCRCKLCQASDMVLKKKPDGKFMVGCQNFPLCRNVVWLPVALSEAAVTNQSCNTCIPDRIFKIQFKFRRLEIPAQYSTEHLGCIGGCDEILKELIETCGTGLGRGRQPAQASVNPRQSACRTCGQLGHSSNECPQQPRGRQAVNSSRGGRPSSSRGRATSSRGGRASRTTSTSSRGRRPGNGSFVSATGEQLSAGDRRCFVCGDPSHFANACPNRV